MVEVEVVVEVEDFEVIEVVDEVDVGVAETGVVMTREVVTGTVQAVGI